MKNMLVHFIREEGAQDLIEYTLLLAFVCLASAALFIGADNGSISHLVVTGDRWVIRRFNDTTHLDPRLTVQAAPLI